jgi:signal peptidase I
MRDASPCDQTGMSRSEDSGLAAAGPTRTDGTRQAGSTDYADEARSPWALLREMLVLLAVALTIAMLLKTFVVQPFYIPSGSMEDTLLVGDKVMVNKMVYHLRPIERGDIVVFDGQGSWDAPAKSAQPDGNPVTRLYDLTIGRLFSWAKNLVGAAPGQVDYIKRVIGLPHDHVVCCNAHGQITVNGVPLNERSYLAPGAKASQYSFNTVVPPGRLWVMGDNRLYSSDSRLHDCGYSDPETTCTGYDRDGTIPEDKVVGRAFMVVWPPNRVRILGIPAVFAQPASQPVAASAAVRSAPFVPLLGGIAVAIPIMRLRRGRRFRCRLRRWRDGRVAAPGLGRR